MEGSRQDEGLVRAQDFVGFLNGVLTVLRKLERNATGGAQIVYRIVGLEVGSAVVELEAESEYDFGADAFEVTSSFAAGVAALSEGTFALQGYDFDTQKAFASLLGPLRKNLRSVTVSTGAIELRLDAEAIGPLELEPEIESAAMGSFSGYIDAVNVHKTPVFYLYPTSGPTRIPCVFDRDLLDSIRDALKQYTSVHGLLEYQAGSPFPSRITAERVEVHPPASTLPTLRSLYGIAPEITGGMDAARFVRRMRDARV